MLLGGNCPVFSDERELVSAVVPIYGMCECLSGWDMTGGGGGSVGGTEGLRRAAAHLLHMPVVQTPQLDKSVHIDMRHISRQIGGGMGWGRCFIILSCPLRSLALALALADYLLSDNSGGGTLPDLVGVLMVAPLLQQRHHWPVHGHRRWWQHTPYIGIGRVLSVRRKGCQ